MVENLKDFIGGTMGGISQVLTGQPFDIIKVRQAASGKAGASSFEIASSIFKQEGPLAFWKGSVPPLVGVGACVSIQFGVVENTKRLLSSIRNGDLKTSDFFLCGAIGGASNTVISAPAEHFRIRMQVQGKVDPRGDPFYKSDLDCIKSIYNKYGMKGAYKGFMVTMLREACTFGTYFGIYEFIVRNYLIPEGGTKDDVAAWKLFMAGGICGFFYWGPWYPVDALKSKLQSDSLANPRYKGSFDCISQTLKAEGIGGFYRGFVPCILRAFPANASTFLAYELTMRAIK